MTTLASTRGPELDPRITVLRRPDGTVQLGWHSGSAVRLCPAGPVESVPALLRLLDGTHSTAQVLRDAAELGFDAATTTAVLEQLAAAGLLVTEEPRSRLRTVRVHGRGPLSDALLEGLRRIGLRPGHSHDRRAETTRARQCAERPDLVLLADTLVPDPSLVTALMRHRVPHLQVRIRDGRGIVGPLVLPGETSCLRCADLFRTGRDPQWPHLAAQLLGRVGTASPAGIAMTAALTLKEIETIRHGSADHPPATLDTTLELDLDALHLDRRPWQPHPNCGCGADAGV
ncbi:TOMM precursor leader peptide-binding protein [Nocardia sp. NBC_00511]|uniref:TOMM precursor leader peptide-binding protein n=1 Tax=Nocardia sp. NBC_00511 TaxID=2903591 RepID=UPI0030E22385